MPSVADTLARFPSLSLTLAHSLSLSPPFPQSCSDTFDALKFTLRKLSQSVSHSLTPS